MRCEIDAVAVSRKGRSVKSKQTTQKQALCHHRFVMILKAFWCLFMHRRQGWRLIRNSVWRRLLRNQQGRSSGYVLMLF